jgi:hypothetical protein
MSGMEKAAQLLKQGSVAQRRKAIKYLTLSNSETALKLLAWAVKNDSDPEIQSYARKGYQHLKASLTEGDSKTTTSTGAASLLAYQQRVTQTQKQVQPEKSQDDDLDFGDESDEVYDDSYDDDYGYDDAYESDDEDDDYGYGYDDTYADDSGYDDDDALFSFDDSYDEPYEAPSTVQRDGPLDMQARKEIRVAMEAHIDGDDQRALRNLISAIRIDSRTTLDNEAKNVAAAVTGMEGSAAMRAIQDKDFQRGFLGKGGKSKSGASGDDPTWATAWMDIGIFTLILTVGLVGAILISSARFVPMLIEFGTNPAYASLFPGGEEELSQTELLELAELLQDGVLFLIIPIIIAVVIVVVANIIHFFVIHIAAVSFFNGAKPSAVTIDKLFNFQTILTGIFMAGLLGSLFLIPNTADAYVSGSGTEILGSIYLAGSAAGSILNLVAAIGQIFVVSRAQQISAVNGCLSILVGGLILGAFQCVLVIGFPILVSLVTALGGITG